MKKSRTGKKIARVIALGLATMVTITSIPVSVNADENALHDTHPIVVDLRSSGNTDDSTSQINNAEESSNAATAAEAAASSAIESAGEAAQAATDAEEAARNAKEVAEKAANAALSLTTEGSAAKNALDNAGSAVDDANNEAITANNLVSEANGLITSANQVVSDANTALQAAANKEEAVSGAIGVVNTARTNAESAVALVEPAKTGAEQASSATRSEAATVENEIKTVLEQTIPGVAEAYDNADKVAKKDIFDIAKNLHDAKIDNDFVTSTEKLKGTAETARDNAGINLKTATDKEQETKGYLDQVTDMVSKNSHDVAGALKIAADADAAATEAENAAKDAYIQAGFAADAEKAAKEKYEKALAAYNKLVQDLANAKAKYNEAYTNVQNIEQKNADDAVLKVKGDIDTYNSHAGNANGLIDAYEGLVDDANTAINTLNGNIDSANTIINGSDGFNALKGTADTKKGIADTAITNANTKESEASGALATAQSELTAAQSAINAADAAVAAARKNYDDAVAASHSAADYASDVDDKIEDIKAAQNAISDQIAIAATRAATTKDDLSKLLNDNETYSSLTAEVERLDGEISTKQGELNDLTTNTYNDEFFSTQNDIIKNETNRISGLETTLSSKKEEKLGFEKENQNIEKKRYGLTDSFYDYKAVLNDPYKTYTVLFWEVRVFTDDDIRNAQAADAKHKENEGKIKTWGDEILTLKQSISEAKLETAPLAVAQKAIDEANRDIQRRRGEISGLSTNKNNLQKKVDKVDSFSFNGETTMTFPLEQIAQYPALAEALGLDYASFNEVDDDTTVYKTVNDGSVPSWVPEWLVGKNVANDADAEAAIEEKYKKEMKEALPWGLRESYEFFWYDDENENTLVSITNDRCVVVCKDVDKLNVLRSTYAKAQADAASIAANGALTRANTAKLAADAAKTSESQALITLNTATTGFKNKLNNIQLNSLNSDAKEYGYDQTSIDKIAGIVSKIENANLTKESAVSKERIQRNVTLNVREGAFDFEHNREKLVLDNISAYDYIEYLEDLGDEIEDLPEGGIKSMLEAAKELLDNAFKAYSDAENANKKAQENLKNANIAAKTARENAEEASRQAKLIKPAPLPSNEDIDDDDDDDDSSSEEPGSGEGGAGVAGTGTIVASAGTIPVIPLPATAAGVAGARTGRRTSRSGVAGVRVDNGEGDGDANGEGDAAKNVVEPKAVASTNGKGKNAAGADKKIVKLEKNEVPLADTPFEEGFDANWLWLLLAVAIVIIGVYTYERRKKAVANADEVKKYKKN